MRTTNIRRCGYILAAGALAWAISLLVTGPLEDDELSRVELGGSLVFQVGVACLIWVLWSKKATGTGRWGRAVLVVQTTLLSLATAWTVAHVTATDPSMADEGILSALDAAWPLSMLWLLVVGATAARARRWPDPLRRALFIAGLWFPVVLVAYLGSDWAGIGVSALWLVTGYGGLGVLLVRHASRLTSVRDGSSPADRFAAPREERTRSAPAP